MKHETASNYSKWVKRDLKCLDKAIDYGASVSAEEWHDFAFKARYVMFESDNLKAYSSFRPEDIALATLEADIVKYIADVMKNGFSERSARKAVKRFITMYNKKCVHAKCMTFLDANEDGVTSYCLMAENPQNIIRGVINSRESLKDFLGKMWLLMVCFSYTRNEAMQRYIISHMAVSLDAVLDDCKPHTFVNTVMENTLRYVCENYTEYLKIKYPKKVVKGTNVEPAQAM